MGVFEEPGAGTGPAQSVAAPPDAVAVEVTETPELSSERHRRSGAVAWLTTAPSLQARLARAGAVLALVTSIFGLLGVVGGQALAAALVAAAGGALMPPAVRTTAQRVSLAAAGIMVALGMAYGVIAWQDRPQTDALEQEKASPEAAVEAWLRSTYSEGTTVLGECGTAEIEWDDDGYCWDRVSSFRAGELYKRPGVTIRVGLNGSSYEACTFVSELGVARWAVTHVEDSCEALGSDIPAPDAPLERFLSGSQMHFLGSCDELYEPAVTEGFLRRSENAPPDAVCARTAGAIASGGEQLHLYELVEARDVENDDNPDVPVLTCIVLGRDSNTGVWAVRDQRASCAALRESKAAAEEAPVGLASPFA